MRLARAPILAEDLNTVDTRLSRRRQGGYEHDKRVKDVLAYTA